MKIGRMNNPHKDVYSEINWIGKKGFDFIDFTIEPEYSTPDLINVKKAKSLLKKRKLGIVGHIGDWRLPKTSDYESLRKSSEIEIGDAIKILKKLGAKTVTIHQPQLKNENYNLHLKKLSSMIKNLLKLAKKQKIMLIIENVDSNRKEETRILETLLKRFPNLGLHIDIGHSNIGVKKNLAFYLIKKYSKRLMHLHFHDNYGKKDNHYALGKGIIPFTKIIKVLKQNKFDRTITAEVFTDKGVLDSKDKLRKWWNQL